MPFTGKDMLKLLLEHGWIERRVAGSHHHLYKDGVRITVPVHGNQDLGNGLERKILKEAGLIKNKS
ncbi:type II toxin-antitoxin system HicA family toxin [Lactobacillus sp. ESL0791]|uniref:type II toxin-antitoxin system HicA family toxin n=1 Tax=Lactobacillus sp. ESL0791 TaxID=2983234 RepID=UPI0023FA3830|nr:type II toxin-antitoxin system HicA family toxin [Lactobacillus sp. ESL0791]MDF7638402.1 type II toxin-antitoxin system HicA family toxin [Lactobacillus sp. ESL0791]